MVINDNHLVELTFSMSWMNRVCSRWLKTLDDIMSWLSSSQEKIIMCWWYWRRAWSKGCIMRWCVSSSRRWDDHELIIKSRKDPSCVDGGQVKSASCVDACQELEARMCVIKLQKVCKAKVWLARAKDMFLVFYRSWCLVVDRIASIGCRTIKRGLD